MICFGIGGGLLSFVGAKTEIPCIVAGGLLSSAADHFRERTSASWAGTEQKCKHALSQLWQW